jgi:hypothetical protein
MMNETPAKRVQTASGFQREDCMNSWNPYEPPNAVLATSEEKEWSPRTRFVLSVQLSVVHFFYAASVGLVIYARPGNYTWASAAWLPGSLLLAQFGSVISPSPLMGLGF